MGHTDAQVEPDQVFKILCISLFLSIQGSPARTMPLTNLSSTPCLCGRKLHFSDCGVLAFAAVELSPCTVAGTRLCFGFVLKVGMIMQRCFCDC